jgi:hypothetical protein
MLLLSSTHKSLGSILLSRLTLASDEIIRENQCMFWLNSETTDHVVCIYEIIEKKLEYRGALHRVFRYCMKVNDSLKREMLFDILICLGLVNRMHDKITMSM